MKYVNSTPNSSGAYQGPRSVPFPGCLPLTDSQAEALVAYNGFVTIIREPDPEIEGSSVTVIPDLEAWEAWTAAQPPEPEPEPAMAEVISLARMTAQALPDAQALQRLSHRRLLPGRYLQDIPPYHVLTSLPDHPASCCSGTH